MVPYLLRHTLCIFVRPSPTLWALELFCQFGKDKEVDVIGLREKQERKAMLVNACHIAGAQANGCRRHA